MRSRNYVRVGIVPQRTSQKSWLHPILAFALFAALCVILVRAAGIDVGEMLQSGLATLRQMLR